MCEIVLVDVPLSIQYCRGDPVGRPVFGNCIAWGGASPRPYDNMHFNRKSSGIKYSKTAHSGRKSLISLIKQML